MRGYAGSQKGGCFFAPDDSRNVGEAQAAQGKGAATPNFLVIGAARSGTTILHYLLRNHPQIFVSKPKELRFFASDGPPNFRGPGDQSVNENWVANWEDYRSHFADTGDAKAIGESTPFYLCAEGAAERIRDHLPHARLIILLRDPAKRAYSSYSYLRRGGREPLRSFRRALDVEDQRYRDNWEFLWWYRRLGLYSAQVERYMQLFPPEQIWIGLYEDLNDRPTELVRSVFRFLEVDDSFETAPKSRVNASGELRSRALQRLMSPRGRINSVARYVVPKPIRQQIRKAISKVNVRRPGIPTDVERELRAYYRPDIEKLETLIGRDLSAWK